MKIRKATFKKGHCWLSLESKNGEYLGTWHITSPGLIKHLKESKLEKYKIKFEEE